MNNKANANRYLNKLLELAYSDSCFVPFDDFNHLSTNVETVTGYKMTEQDIKPLFQSDIKKWLLKGDKND